MQDETNAPATWREATLLQHLGEETSYAGAVTPPIFQTSLFVQPGVSDFLGKIKNPTAEPDKFVYTRMGNPTLRTAEQKIAMLEGTEAAVLFSSGMAAITAAILHSTRAGGHVVCVDTAYWPTAAFLREYLPRFGVTTTFVTGTCPEEIADATRPETQLIMLESPSSGVFRFQDLPAVTAFAKSRGIKTAIDNSYASPLFQKPHAFGVDIVLHSATKYLSGHSDVVAGVLCADQSTCDQIVCEEGQWLGARLAPFDAWLLLRGLRTLRLRVEHSQRQAEALAAFLKSRAEVDQLFYAADPDHPQAHLYRKQMTGATALMSFAPKVQDPARVNAFVEALQIFQLGVSWGGHESLAVPLQANSADWPAPKRIVRLYAGFEDTEDLAADLDQAFQAHLTP